MDAVEYLASLSGLWWVLLILFLVMLGVYGLYFYWQRSTPKLLKKVPQIFHHIQTECRKIVAETRTYSPDDPLPYGPIVAGIHRQLDIIANQLVLLKSEYIEIQDRVHALHLRPWQILIGAPFYLYSWYTIRGDTHRILRDHDDLQKLVDVAWQEMGEIKRQAWLVAQRAREITSREAVVRKLLDDLSDHKLYGDTFEIAATHEESVIEALERIPEYFLMADEELVTKTSTKDAVCELYGLLNQAEPVLDEISDRLTLWTAEYGRLSGKMHQVKLQLDSVENLIANKPGEIDCTEESKQLRAVHTTVDVLTATMSRLEVESFPLVDQELDRAQALISEMGRQVRKALRRYPSLNALISDLLGIQKDCSEIFGGLLKSPQYPLLWNRSNTEFLELNKATKDLNLIQKSRTVEQIELDLASIEALSMRWATLRVILNEIAAQHKDLLDIQTRIEIQQGLDWLQEYKQISEQIVIYHPDNWAGADAVSSYPGDILKIEAEHQAFVGRDSTQSVPESELPAWIEQGNKLIGNHQNLRLRSEKVRARLEWLKYEEEKAREQYQAARSVVNQMSWIVNSNAFLKSLAEADLKRINQDLDRLGTELDKSNQGMIEKKVRLIRAEREEITISAKSWLERLNQDIERRRSLLADKINRLNQVAKIDDPVFEKARRLLANEERRAEQIDLVVFSSSTPEEMTIEMRGRSTTWQELVAVQEELEEIVETPLLNSFQHASELRNLALLALDRAAQKIPESCNWPPTSASIAQEKNEVVKLEEKWKALKDEHIRAIWAVRQYGELAASYQVVAGKLDSSYQWASQEQEKVLGLEREIGHLLRQWQQKGQKYSQDPLVFDQLRELRARTTLALDHLKQKWVSNSPGVAEAVTYQELVQEIEGISSYLKTTSLTVHQVGGETFDLYLEESPKKAKQVNREH